ncbi:unnamed protein product [Linum tenue]|uniref:Uncharacterized protein n=1 Tax=Linum tenue TaxID=586396 RepID=A0AAV0GTM1_9ROSI|nr:unnamed protein product [Linum tenue]
MELQENDGEEGSSYPSQQLLDLDKGIGDGSSSKSLGGFRTLPFIFATEIGERFSYIGFHSNLITYLTQQLNLPLVSASNIITNFNGTTNFTPLIGALIADSFAGNFWTLIVGILIFQLGMISVTTTAVVKSLHPPPCPSQVECKQPSVTQMGSLYFSLFLIACGLGGIRPCVVTFAADQLDMKKKPGSPREDKSTSWNLFNWYYIMDGLARLAAFTVVVYVQDNIGWGWGLGLPTIAMAVSIGIFFFGSPWYNRVKPKGSPMIRLAQVIVAAVKKRTFDVPNNSELLYRNDELDAAISVHGRLLHTSQFKWLDKAATVKPGELSNGNPPNPWKLATVHRVEELKAFIRILPIWAASILLVMATSHNHSFLIQQGRTMDRHLWSSFQIPPASLSVFSIFTLVIGLIAYERLFVPIIKHFTGNPSGLTALQRLGVGLCFHILQTAVSALVEIKRKAVAAEYGLLDHPEATIPMTVFWLVPQLSLQGVAEVFTNVGQLEFMYEQAPESMKSIAVGLNWIGSSVGDYLGSTLVLLVHKYSGEEHNWLPDRNLNRGRLDYYYWLISAIQVGNLVYFSICAASFTSNPAAKAADEDGDRTRDEQLVTHLA